MTPMDYASEMTKIFEIASYEEIRSAWKEVTRYGRQNMNLNEFLKPWLTEKIFLAMHPKMRVVRERILNSEKSSKEKCKEYAFLVKKEFSSSK